MNNIFLCSDHHLGHKNIIKFENTYRPFNTIEEMHEHLVQEHNKVVKKGDRVIFVGDVAWNSESLEIVGRMNGQKILVFGNHDSLNYTTYGKYFYKLAGVLYLERNVVTHIPVHECQFDRFKYNIHGHLHSKNVTKTVMYMDGQIKIEKDERYKNVSIEQLPNLAPIAYEDLMK